MIQNSRNRITGQRRGTSFDSDALFPYRQRGRCGSRELPCRFSQTKSATGLLARDEDHPDPEALYPHVLVFDRCRWCPAGFVHTPSFKGYLRLYTHLPMSPKTPIFVSRSLVFCIPSYSQSVTRERMPGKLRQNPASPSRPRLNCHSQTVNGVPLAAAGGLGIIIRPVRSQGQPLLNPWAGEPLATAHNPKLGYYLSTVSRAACIYRSCPTRFMHCIYN